MTRTPQSHSRKDWLHRLIAQTAHMETEPWAIDRVRRVEERLQAGRPEQSRLTVEIPWLEAMRAFTTRGRYIHFSRRLYERCATDEQVAFIVAHEIAHHDLGHISSSGLDHVPGAEVLGFGAQLFTHALYGPEREAAADQHGLNLCLAAGYDGSKCLEVFDILEQHALDMGDDDLVYGPDDALMPDVNWLNRMRTWAWQRRRGYFSIYERRQRLQNYLAQRRRVSEH
jgi:hypothetical protein